MAASFRDLEQLGTLKMANTCRVVNTLAQVFETSKLILALIVEQRHRLIAMSDWRFLSNHGRALVCIAHDPGVRLRDIATRLDITERTAFGIVTDLTKSGYVVKDRDGRRNHYEIQPHLPLGEAIGRETTIAEFLDLLVETKRA